MPGVILTVFFDGQFWIGIFERAENGKPDIAGIDLRAFGVIRTLSKIIKRHYDEP